MPDVIPGSAAIPEAGGSGQMNADMEATADAFSQPLLVMREAPAG